MRNRCREEDSDVVWESSGDGRNLYGWVEGKGEIYSRNEVFIVVDYV